MTRQVRCLKRQQHKKWDVFKEINSEKVYKLYKEARNSAKRALIAPRMKYEQGLTDDSVSPSRQRDTKKLFAYMKRRTRTYHSSPPLEDHMGNIVTDNQQNAGLVMSVYNEFFCRKVCFSKTGEY